MYFPGILIFLTILPLHGVNCAPSKSELLVDCPRWPYPDSHLDWPQKSCITYKDVVVDGGRAEIWREASIPSPSTNAIVRDRLFKTRGHVAEVVGFYSHHLKINLQKTFAVKLTMVHGDKIISSKDPSAEAVTNAETGGRPCHVVVKIIPSKPKTWIAHLVAHELYHCVQFQENHDRQRSNDDILWVLDGSANFFEYLQYPYNPPKSVDENAPHYYDPSEPLYDQTQQYTSCLFFHYLHNAGWNLPRIDTWVRERNLTTSDVAERSALADDSAISSAFSRFATKFHDNRIYFDTKKTIKINTNNPIPERPRQDINLPHEGDTTSLDFGSIPSWTFKKYSVQLQPKQTIATSFIWTDQPAPNVVVWYRRLRSGTKQSGWARTFPKILHSGCSGTAITYEFLVVPIANQATVQGSMQFKRETDAKCSCPTKTPGHNALRREIKEKNLRMLEARQQNNGSEGCYPDQRTTTAPHLQQIDPHRLRIADAIRSFMGFTQYTRPATLDSLSTVSCSGSTSDTLITMTKLRYETLTLVTEQQTQGPFSLSQGPDTMNSHIWQPTQVLETTKPFPTSTVFYTTNIPTLEVNDSWMEEDEVWDEPWELPEPATESDEDSQDDANDSDTPPQEEDNDCPKPKLGCFYGNWTADRASMEEHSKHPYFRYSPPPFSPLFSPDTAKYSATYNLDLRRPTPEEQSRFEGRILAPYHEVLVEYGENSASSGNSNTFIQWASTTTMDGTMSADGEAVESQELGTFETGRIFRWLAADTTAVSELKLGSDHNPLSVVDRYDGNVYGPRDIYYKYNCSANTLHLESRVTNGRKYVMHRG
jgi:hypothetical protein